MRVVAKNRDVVASDNVARETKITLAIEHGVKNAEADIIFRNWN
jgi:hypothetical protein